MNSKAWHETIDLALMLLPDEPKYNVHRERLTVLKSVVGTLAIFLDRRLKK